MVSWLALQIQVCGIQLLLIINFAKIKHVWRNRPARGAGKWQVSLYFGLVILFLKVYRILARVIEQVHLRMLQTLSDVQISGSSPGRSPDTEVTPMPCWMMIANVHSGLTMSAGPVPFPSLSRWSSGGPQVSNCGWAVLYPAPLVLPLHAGGATLMYQVQILALLWKLNRVS